MQPFRERDYGQIYANLNTVLPQVVSAVRTGDMSIIEDTRARLSATIGNIVTLGDQAVPILANGFVSMASLIGGAGCPKNQQLFCPHSSSIGCKKTDTCVIYDIWENTK